MPEIKLILYRDEDESVPILNWLDELPAKVQDKCLVRLERLEALGNALRRPEADYLRDGIYELRVRHQSVNYRILYFFAGNTVAVVSHGLTKERAVPSKEIDQAIERRRRFEADPNGHTHQEP